MKNSIERYYDSDPQMEWDRLATHQIEFAQTCMALDEFIGAQSRILDVGGGPGRYAFYLAQEGHAVSLLDLSSGHIDFAKRKSTELAIRLAEAYQGDALALSNYGVDEFDVVLLMGPLYHLTEFHDRQRCLAESLRVLKPGGLIFLAFISRFSPIINCLRSEPELIGQAASFFSDLCRDGSYKPSAVGGFTEAFFSTPEDIERLVAPFPLEKLRLATTDGLAILQEERLTSLAEGQFQQWMNLLYQIGTDHTLLGAGEHILYVGKKESRELTGDQRKEH